MHFNFPKLNIKLIVNESELDLARIDNALILFHANWSGPSILNISGILGKLNEIEKRLDIYIIDIDCVSLDFIKNILGHMSHGHGEAVYIVNKEVKAKCREQLNKREFDDFVKILCAE